MKYILNGTCIIFVVLHFKINVLISGADITHKYYYLHTYEGISKRNAHF